MNMITAKDLCRDFKLGDGTTFRVLNNIQIEIPEQKLAILRGPSGSGKTTLMKTLLGLQKPYGGTITFGDELTKKDIGYLPQQTLVQRDFPAAVREIVLSGCQAKTGLRPFYNKAEKKLAEDNMEKMGITHLKDRCYRELSGGQQQRVLLARALCATGKLLLLDEPVAGLDPKVTAEMYALIESLNKEGISIIMISHDISAALKYASHILHIGETIYFGTKKDYLESSLGRNFLGQEV